MAGHFVLERKLIIFKINSCRAANVWSWKSCVENRSTHAL